MEMDSFILLAVRPIQRLYELWKIFSHTLWALKWVSSIKLSPEVSDRPWSEHFDQESRHGPWSKHHGSELKYGTRRGHLAIRKWPGPWSKHFVLELRPGPEVRDVAKLKSSLCCECILTPTEFKYYIVRTVSKFLEKNIFWKNPYLYLVCISQLWLSNYKRQLYLFSQYIWKIESILLTCVMYVLSCVSTRVRSRLEFHDSYFLEMKICPMKN